MTSAETNRYPTSARVDACYDITVHRFFSEVSSIWELSKNRFEEKTKASRLPNEKPYWYGIQQQVRNENLIMKKKGKFPTILG